jgi:aryl-alcohol dehydrogenase-like predicted oxidoreductase
MVQSVEQSLRRLGTDYIDLLYLHVWDGITPVEEVLRAMDDLVRAGKVLYVGISDTPAWQVSRMQAIADLRGWAPLVALLDPAVTAPIIGARTLAQLEDNLGALDVRFTDDERAALDAVSAVELGFPHDFLARDMPRGLMRGGARLAID